MIELMELQAQNVVGIKISEKIEKTDIDKTTKAIEDKLAVYDKVRLYIELENYTGFSLEAFVEDIKYGLPHLKDIEKEAIVLDGGWLEKLAEINDKLFPNGKIRRFSFAQKDEAIKWVQS